MLGLFRLLTPMRFIAPLVLAFVVWQGVVFMKPRPEPWSPTQQRALADMASQFADRLADASQAQAESETPLRTGIIYLGNDPLGEATEALREVLEQDSRFALDKKSVPVRFLTDIKNAVSSASSINEIMHAGRNVSLDLVIWGKVDSVDLEQEYGRATATLQVIRPGSPDAHRTIGLTGYDRPEPEVITPAVVQAPLWLTGVAILAVLLLPWVGAPLVSRVVTMKSNAASAGLLATHMGAAIAGLAVCGVFKAAGDWQPAALGTAVCLIAAYDFWACEQIAARDL